MYPKMLKVCATERQGVSYGGGPTPGRLVYRLTHTGDKIVICLLGGWRSDW